MKVKSLAKETGRLNFSHCISSTRMPNRILNLPVGICRENSWGNPMLGRFPVQAMHHEEAKSPGVHIPSVPSFVESDGEEEIKVIHQEQD